MMNNTTAAEMINAQQTQAMTTAELMTARLTKNTVLSEALYALKRAIPGYMEAIEIPSDEEGYFDYVFTIKEYDQAHAIVLRHKGYVQIYFEYKVYNIDLLDPNLEDVIEELPGIEECCGDVNPYDIMEGVASQISEEIRYNDLMLARRKYRQ